MAGAVAFLQTASDTTDVSTYTFAAQNLGTAAADRCIIVAVHARDTGTGAKTISSVTVNGVAAVIAVQNQAASTNSTIVGIAIAEVPTGTSGDIVVVFSEAMIRCSVAAFAATGIDETAHDTGLSDATDPTNDLDVPAEGIAVACASFGTAGTFSWTGLTERYDAQVESASTISGASDAFATTQSGLTITANGSTSTEIAGAFASWGPGAAPPGGSSSGNLMLLGCG